MVTRAQPWVVRLPLLLPLLCGRAASEGNQSSQAVVGSPFAGPAGAEAQALIADDPNPEPTDEEILALFDKDMARAMSELAFWCYCGTSLVKETTVEQCQSCKAAGFEVSPGSVTALSLPFNETFVDANFLLLGEWRRLEPIRKAIPARAGCFIAIRGSFNDANWIQNFQVNLTDAGMASCTGCRVRQGYLDIVLTAKPHVLRWLDAHGCGVGGAPIFVTGHSLGGATAAIFIAVLTDMGYTVALSYLLETTRSGNEAFRDYFRKVVAAGHPPVPVFRMANDADMVLRYPPLEMGYSSLQYEIYSHPPSSQLQVCRVPNDPKCAQHYDNSSWWYQKSLLIAHIVLWYAPGRFQIALQPMCGRGGPVAEQLAWWLVGWYTNLVGGGYARFVGSVALQALLLLLPCCACVHLARRRRSGYAVLGRGQPSDP
uniref:Fungal lipase-type domain-containing protein n=1 Tax=Alexandrium monilatum TaxID=311494 RepID=A0A7S4QEP5_9DINO